MTQIVFLTLFLGLTMGRQPVSVDVTGAVARVEIALDGKPVAMLSQAPFRASVDFGSRLVPRRLVARALDASGAELARVEQRINVPHATTEAGLVLEANGARLIWQSLESEKPKDVQWMLDGAPLAAKSLRATLPKLDADKPHLLRAVATTATGQVVDAELVFGGGLTGTTASTLTPVPLRVETNADAKKSIHVNGSPASVVAVERLPADIIVVRNPSLVDFAFRVDFDSRTRRRSGFDTFLGNATVPVERRQGLRFLWPSASRTRGTSAADLFPSSRTFMVADAAGMRGVLANVSAPLNEPFRYADAVAVAALQAAASRRPRAVVLIIGTGHRDMSQLSPRQAKEYLDSIGVPLFVWTISETTPPEWGEARRIDGSDRLRDAAADLLEEVQRQRIAWIAGDYMLDEIRVSGERVAPLFKNSPSASPSD
ncbi:MAG TPA: hypothetical protein VKB93_22975 [Thermoanaerobaculia bacterium]|nr:hypothetical protein [Thermoanaerobaculia bacterium]